MAHNGVRLVKEQNNRGIRSQTGSDSPQSATNSSRIVLGNSYRIILAPAYAIVALRENSPAELAGLMLGDVIVQLNGSGVHNYSLQHIMHLFYSEEGKRIRLKVDRKGKFIDFSFNLKSPIK